MIKSKLTRQAAIVLLIYTFILWGIMAGYLPKPKFNDPIYLREWNGLEKLPDGSVQPKRGRLIEVNSDGTRRYVDGE